MPIPALILPRETDVFIHAVQRAAITAKPLTRLEKRSAVTRLLTEHSDWSNHRIAEVAGVSRLFVANLRNGGNVAPTDEGQAETEGEAALPVRRGPDPAQQAHNRSNPPERVSREVVRKYAGSALQEWKGRLGAARAAVERRSPGFHAQPCFLPEPGWLYCGRPS